LAEFRRLVLERFAQAVPHDSAVFLSPTTGERSLVRKAPAHFQRYLEGRQRYEFDLAKTKAAASVQNGLFIDSEVFSVRERDRSPFFQEILRPQGIRQRLGIHLYFRQRLTGLLFLCRQGRQAFTRGDGERLRPVLPALGLAHAALDVHRAPPLGSTAEPPVQLTPQELRVAVRAASGLQNKEIASLLGTSPLTVRNQMARIFQKTSVSGRAQLAHVLWRQGFLGSSSRFVEAGLAATARAHDEL
jgi:DNA-binding CsgD family transcriptional regulator